MKNMKITKKKQRDTILIVDDMELNRAALADILSGGCDILQAEDGRAAVNILYNSSRLPSIVLLDIMMPGMDGFEVLDLIKSNTRTSGIPVIFITGTDTENAEIRGLRAGAVDYISKPFSAEIVKARVDNHLELKRYRDSLEEMVETKVRQLVINKENMLVALASVIEYRNLEPSSHIKRMSILSRMIVECLLEIPGYSRQLNERNHKSLLKAVPIHDVGKIAVPDNILLKPGRLSLDEFEVIKTHTTIASDMIDTLLTYDDGDEYLLHCRDICRHHHERFDGKGYPDGLAGGAIPLSARIVSIVDVYDVLISRTIYKPAMPHDEAIRVIRREAGTQFDPELVKIFDSIQSSSLLLPIWGDAGA